MKTNILSSGVVFDLAKLEETLSECEKEKSSPDFFSNVKLVKEVGRKQKYAEDRISLVKKLDGKFADLKTLIEMLEQEEDDGLFNELCQSLTSLQAELEDLKLETLLSGKYDNNNAIVTLHAGAGGTEAQDWTQMLYRMYTMYAEKQGYKLQLIDVLDGDEAGIKSITFLVDGENAYGYLKAEKGVHRLVRISPFDANARRHTSFASVEVMPELDETPDIEIRPEDLKVDTYRSSGAGGQHVNKTESAIRITHIPTGIVVSCQTERSQIQNRETAMKMLYGKLAEKQEQEEMEKLQSIRGDIKKIEWGSQIRSYVFHPYNLVKDHRTNYETSNIQAVMDGDIQPFIVEYLKHST